jgi:hypothetical protein
VTFEEQMSDVNFHITVWQGLLSAQDTIKRNIQLDLPQLLAVPCYIQHAVSLGILNEELE